MLNKFSKYARSALSVMTVCVCAHGQPAGIAAQAITVPTVPIPEKEVQLEETNNESYFTETLARIYNKQGRYEKALEIIQRLNLNYPKKNAYFADQIRFLEKLILNNKNNK